MSRIMFLGDPHFTSKSPVSRKETPEQYRALMLEKMESVKQIALELGVDTLIILGDTFNNNSGLLNEYEAAIWELFFNFKLSGIDTYTIVGNHDLNFLNANEFKGTYLYKAFLTGAIKHLDELCINGVQIKGFDYGQDFKQTEDYNRYSICVAHSFYENEMFGGTGNYNLTHNKCVDLGYQAYVLGHDHVPYDFVKEKGYIVVRPGALMRGTSKTCNLYRTVQVAVFNTDDLSWEYKVIPTKLGTEVFNDKVVMTKQLDIDVNVKQLLENFEASKGNNIYDIINERKEHDKVLMQEKYDKIIALITQYLEASGVYKNLGD